MCKDMKIQSQASKSKAKYKVGNFCTQYGLPSIAPSKRKSREKGSSEKFHRKRTASKYYRKQKYIHFKDNDFYKKGRKSRPIGKHGESIPKASKQCFNCEKKGHFRKECRSKAKTLINTLVSDQTNKEEIFKLLELDHMDSESSSTFSDQEIYQLNQSSSSRVSSSTSSSPDIGMACKDSCCRNKTINVLSSQEELLIDLIEQIEDPVIKAQYLSKFHKSLVKETKEPEPRTPEPKVNLEKIYNRFTNTRKEVTVNDLQHEIKETKSEVRTLKQELTILRVDHNFLDQRLKHLENTTHQGNEESSSFQNPSNDEDETINPIADMVLEQPTQKFLETISRINFQKWHSKVRIVISKDIEFQVIALVVYYESVLGF